MKKGILWLVSVLLLAALLCGCGNNAEVPQTASEQPAETATPAQEETATPAQEETATPAQEETVAPDQEETAEEPEEDTAVLADGEYLVEFHTDSSMFHVNEACEGKSVLTVQNGQMSIHVILPSKSVVNLYYGMAEDAKQEGAELIQPTLDSVTYRDGMTEEVYGFDIPVPALDTDFQVALIGTHGNWYDHVVSVSLMETP